MQGVGERQGASSRQPGVATLDRMRECNGGSNLAAMAGAGAESHNLNAPIQPTTSPCQGEPQCVAQRKAGGGLVLHCASHCQLQRLVQRQPQVQLASFAIVLLGSREKCASQP